MAMRARTLVFVLIAAVLVVVTAPGSGTAQETQSPLVGGAWALQFRVSENFTLSTFEGSVVSLKRHYSPSTALRLGVSLALRSSDETSGFSNPDTVNSRDLSDDTYQLGFALHYLHYTNPGSRVTPFLGAGPAVSFNHSKRSTTVSDVEATQSYKYWSAGLSGVLGVEWFPSSSVGIHAEYGLSAKYTKQTNDAEYMGQKEDRDGHSWSLTGSSVLFGLSVYF
jgi:opacity protein-like surface antigen